ncbi:hypothetical protein B0H19DRAFT_1273439 [Mycena capillaripes]|nr:hypothetical protein B0H19DRAFT_1273439 [Mycena capillaripes]
MSDYKSRSVSCTKLHAAAVAVSAKAPASSAPPRIKPTGSSTVEPPFDPSSSFSSHKTGSQPGPGLSSWLPSFSFSRHKAGSQTSPGSSSSARLPAPHPSTFHHKARSQPSPGSSSSAPRHLPAPPSAASRFKAAPPPGPGSSAPRHHPASSSSALTGNLELARLQYVVAIRFGDRSLLEPADREKAHHQKFVLVLQAFVTLCTAQPGEDDVSIMVALGDDKVTLFICQNENGRHSFDKIEDHLQNIWKFLRKIHTLPPSTTSTPLNTDQGKLDSAAGLLDVAYGFVASKQPSSNYLQALVSTFLALALTVRDLGLNPLASPEWNDVRTFTRMLYNLMAEEEYVASIEEVPAKALEFGFNFKKSLEKHCVPLPPRLSLPS